MTIDFTSQDALFGKNFTVYQNQMTETTITKEQLDELWNAIEYTLGTISYGNRFQVPGRKDWCEVHLGRTEQSCAFLQQAKDLVNQLKKEFGDD